MTTYVKILGACTTEIWEDQKFENLARYRTTFEFDREYLRNRSRYQVRNKLDWQWSPLGSAKKIRL